MKKTNRSHVFGRAKADPLKSLPADQPIFFTHFPVKGLVSKPATSIRNWEFFRGILLQIAFTGPSEHKIEGSGVLVAPGVAYCATHVIEPHLKSIVTGDVIASCFGITESEIQIWSIKGVTISEKSDICILALEFRSNLPRNNQFFISPMTTRTPSLGEELMICGFKAVNPVFETAPNGVVAGGAVMISVGHVIEVFPRGRDSAMIPWPSVAVDVTSTGGMSGGPVYEKTGKLIGLLCSSIEDDLNGVSYVSLIWPSLATKFKGHWPKNFYQGAEQSILELPEGACKLEKPEALIKVTDHSGTRVYYEPWS